MLLTVNSIFGQIQKGYVKTPGRYDKKGEGIADVLVKPKGNYNTVTSNNKGEFSLLLDDLKNGEAYVLQRIYKKNYKLLEPEIIGRDLAFSDKATVTIVMMLATQYQEEVFYESELYYERLEKNYLDKVNELEKAINENKISQELYDKKIAQLKEDYISAQYFVKDLAENYVRIDYDALDSLSCKIINSIKNGDLDYACELLQPVVDLLREEKEHLTYIEDKNKQAQKILTESEQDMKKLLEQQIQDAQALYFMYTISLLRLEKDKAMYYLDQRAQLDTTVAEWQLEAGLFCMNYMADYDKAIEYFQLASHGSGSDLEGFNFVVSAYINLSTAYQYKGMSDKADYYYNLAYTIAERDKDNPSLAILYNNKGYMLAENAYYEEALLYFNKALNLSKKHEGYEAMTATIYNNMGMIRRCQNRYDEALGYYKTSLAMRRELFGEMSPYTAESYNNIGDVYGRMANINKSYKYLQKALDIRIKILGEKHPLVAQSYSNIGKIYVDQNDSDNALTFCLKAKKIFIDIDMDESLGSASNYINLGNAYHLAYNNSAALDCLEKSLHIREKMLPPDHPDIAEAYYNMGVCYYDNYENDLAKDSFYKSLAIYEKLFNANSPIIKTLKQYIRDLEK